MRLCQMRYISAKSLLNKALSIYLITTAIAINQKFQHKIEVCMQGRCKVISWSIQQNGCGDTLFGVSINAWTFSHESPTSLPQAFSKLSLNHAPWKFSLPEARMPTRSSQTNAIGWSTNMSPSKVYTKMMTCFNWSIKALMIREDRDVPLKTTWEKSNAPLANKAEMLEPFLRWICLKIERSEARRRNPRAARRSGDIRCLGVLMSSSEMERNSFIMTNFEGWS